MSEPDITVYRSEIDGHWVVEIDTPEIPETNEGPVMRIYLNGGQVYSVGEGRNEGGRTQNTGRNTKRSTTVHETNTDESNKVHLTRQPLTVRWKNTTKGR